MSDRMAVSLAVRISASLRRTVPNRLCAVSTRVRSCPPGSAWFQRARPAPADRAHNLAVPSRGSPSLRTPTLSGLDSGAGPVDDAQDLLLVVQHRTVIRQHPRRVMRGNGQGIDTACRDGQAEVVANEREPARIVVRGACHLAKAVQYLQVCGRSVRLDQQPGLL